MSGLDLILAALAAGATAGVTGIADDAVRDAYARLRNLIRHRLAGRAGARAALDTEESDPDRWRERIGADLTASGADENDQILAAARRLLELVGPPTETGRYRVDVRDSQGVIVGDHGTVNITVASSDERDRRR